MSEPNEREHLTDGLNSEFWRLFQEHVTREWGPGGLAYQQAVQNAAEHANAVVELQKVLFTQKAIHALMCWPGNRLTQLQQKPTNTLAMASRRGPGL